MRQLDSDELLEKFKNYSSDIQYCEVDDMTVKTTQFFNFLFDQEISKRILERIEEDFYVLKEALSIDHNKRNGRFYSEITNLLATRELQGAFGYLCIYDHFKINPKYRTHFIDMTRIWHTSPNHNESKQKFNTYFFDPFVDLFEWYLRESITAKNTDYFSEKTQEKIFERLDKLEKTILGQLGTGQEIVFNEINDVKKLTKKLNKKNWDEIIKGKFIDLALNNIITIDIAKKIIEFIIGEEIKLLK